jgi:hypothetical protein
MTRRIAFALAAMLAVAACSAQAVGTVVPAATPTQAAVTQAAPTQAVPTEAPTPVVTPAPTGPATYKVGDTVTVTQNGSDWAKITISDVKTVASYKAQYYTDTPKTAGDVFIQAKVTYAALQDGVTYNPFDWQVFCAGTAVDTFTIVINGPTPVLHSGTLPNARNASGYVVYEVPAKGEVRMSYGGTFGGVPVFEVIIRAA